MRVIGSFISSTPRPFIHPEPFRILQSIDKQSTSSSFYKARQHFACALTAIGARIWQLNSFISISFNNYFFNFNYFVIFLGCARASHSVDSIVRSTETAAWWLMVGSPSPIEPTTTLRPYYLFFLSFLCLCQCGDQEDRGCRWGRGGGIYRFVALAIVHSPNTQTQATFFPFIRSFIHSFIGDCIGNNSPLLSISHSWQHILPPPHPPTTLHPQSVISLLLLLLLLLLFFYRRYILPPSPIDERTHARTQLSQFSVLLFLFSLFVFYFILFYFIYCVVEIGWHYAPSSPCIRRRLLLLLGVVCWCVDVDCSWDSSQWGTREYLFEFLTTIRAVLTKKLQKMSLPFSINGSGLSSKKFNEEEEEEVALLH